MAAGCCGSVVLSNLNKIQNIVLVMGNTGLTFREKSTATLGSLEVGCEIHLLHGRCNLQ